MENMGFKYVVSRIFQEPILRFLLAYPYAHASPQPRCACAGKFSPDLAFHVSSSLERLGYSIFGAHALNRLFAQSLEGRACRRHLQEEFAAFCGANVGTTPHFKSARFTMAMAVGS